MTTFWASDLFTWIRMAASRIQQLPGVQKFIFDDKIGIPILKNLTFWVSDLYTWIRLAASRIQQLPGVQNFFLPYLEFSHQKKINFTYIITFWVSYPKDGVTTHDSTKLYRCAPPPCFFLAYSFVNNNVHSILCDHVIVTLSY